MKVIIAPTANLAQTILADLSVEAEYGSIVIEGTQYTAAHHQAQGLYKGRHIGGGRPAPCNDSQIPFLADSATALVSHIDVDTLGGLMRAQARLSHLFEAQHSAFWDFAESVDVSGWHKADPKHSEFLKLSALAAWIQDNRPQIPRDQISDISDFCEKAFVFAERVLSADDQALDVGARFINNQNNLNETSWLTTTPANVVVRKSDSFVNHLYRDPNDLVGAAIVAYNTKLKSITISLESPIANISCRQIVQDLWGMEAGGHDGIAGSPRGQDMSEADLITAVNAVSQRLVSL